MDDGVTGLSLRLQGNGRARAVYVDHLLASSLQRLQELTLHLRQLDVRAVTTLEAIDIHGHLLTFEAWCDTTAEDHLVDTLQLGNSLLIVDGQLTGNVDLHRGAPGLHGLETNLYLKLLSLFCIQYRTGWCCSPNMVSKLLLSVDVKFEVSGALNIDYILASLLWGEGGFIFG